MGLNRWRFHMYSQQGITWVQPRFESGSSSGSEKRNSRIDLDGDFHHIDLAEPLKRRVSDRLV